LAVVAFRDKAFYFMFVASIMAYLFSGGTGGAGGAGGAGRSREQGSRVSGLFINNIYIT